MAIQLVEQEKRASRKTGGATELKQTRLNHESLLVIAQTLVV